LSDLDSPFDFEFQTKVLKKNGRKQDIGVCSKLRLYSFCIMEAQKTTNSKKTRKDKKTEYVLLNKDVKTRWY
jgi:hypothetical protein